MYHILMLMGSLKSESLIVKQEKDIRKVNISISIFNIFCFYLFTFQFVSEILFSSQSSNQSQSKCLNILAENVKLCKMVKQICANYATNGTT